LNNKYCIGNKIKPVYVLGVEMVSDRMLNNGYIQCLVKELLRILS